MKTFRTLILITGILVAALAFNTAVGQHLSIESKYSTGYKKDLKRYRKELSLKKSEPEARLNVQGNHKGELEAKVLKKELMKQNRYLKTRPSPRGKTFLKGL